MEFMLYLLSLLFYFTTTLAIEQPTAVIVNNIKTNSLVDVDSAITYPGKITLNLETGVLDLPLQEWAPSLEAIKINSGKLYISNISGHWQTINLPKDCLTTLETNSILTISGEINNTKVTNLECKISTRKQ